jgi:hypothetical protein
MKPTIRPGYEHYDQFGKFDGDKKVFKHRGRQENKKIIEEEMIEAEDLLKEEQLLAEKEEVETERIDAILNKLEDDLEADFWETQD